jgi:phage tail sheath protein FI
MPTYAAPGVYVEEVPSSEKSLSAAPTAIAAFVGFTEKAPKDDPNDPDGLAPRLVTSWTQYEALYGSFAKGAVLPLSVYGYFANGGSIAYIVRIPNTEPSGKPSRLELPAPDRALGLPIAVESLEPDAELSRQVTTDDSAATDDGPSPFNLTVRSGNEDVETFENLTLTPGDRNVASVVNGTSTKIKVELLLDAKTDLSGQLEVVKPGVYSLQKEAATPVAVNGRKFAGSESSRQGINGLAVAEDVTMVIVPDLITAATKDDGSVDLGLWKAVQTTLISHCEQHGNRMAVLDAPPGMSPQQIKDWRSDVAMYDSAYAALYYPWIKVENPIGTNGDAEVLIPPSGHVAGVWARTDDQRGVHKAPANEVVMGATSLGFQLTSVEQGELNRTGINCIRAFSGRGIRVWGARTLSSDPEWRYINVRRLFNFVSQTLMEGTQWSVFEPNDEKLWIQLRIAATNFLTRVWSDGALFGSTPAQAFYVKCDSETNPPEVIEAGQVICEIGIAPVKPAEFVVFRLSQFSGGEGSSVS